MGGVTSCDHCRLDWSACPLLAVRLQRTMPSAAPTDPFRESQRMSSAELRLTLLVHRQRPWRAREAMNDAVRGSSGRNRFSPVRPHLLGRPIAVSLSDLNVILPPYPQGPSSGFESTHNLLLVPKSLAAIRRPLLRSGRSHLFLKRS